MASSFDEIDSLELLVSSFDEIDVFEFLASNFDELNGLELLASSFDSFAGLIDLESMVSRVYLTPLSMILQVQPTSTRWMTSMRCDSLTVFNFQ